MKQKNKGITLIALVITIIVMLILVAVTINLAINGGLFDYARRASTETGAEVLAEKEMANLQTGLSTETLIGKYIQVPWHETSTGIFSNGLCTVRIGDYINYNCYNGTEYSESNFNVTSDSNSSIKWQVLGVEDGNLLILSKDSLGNLQLSGARGYNDGVDRLDTICGIYGHGENAVGARSIKMRDVDKITGYDPTTYGTGYVYQYKNGPVIYTKVSSTSYTITYKYGNNMSGTSSGFLKPLGYVQNNCTRIEVPESTSYMYSPTSYMATDTPAFNLLFGDGTSEGGKAYWIADTEIRACSGYVTWGIFKTTGQTVQHNDLWDSSSGAQTRTDGVRAVIALKSDIKLKPAAAASTWDFDTPEE